MNNIEWQFISIKNHYGYQKKKSEKTVFEIREMTVEKEVTLNIGDVPKYHTQLIKP